MKMNKDAEDSCDGDTDEDIVGVGQLHEWQHTINSMVSKKKRVVTAIDKRINETLFMKKVYLNHYQEKQKLLDLIKESLG